VDAFWKKGLKIKKGILSVSIQHWQKVMYNNTYTWGLIKAYGFNPTQIVEVQKILTAGNGAYIASATHQLMKWGKEIHIIDKQAKTERIVIENADVKSVDTGYGKLYFEYIENINLASISKDPNIAYLDAHKISWPLLFRTWAPTDYFYPLGLGKKKKLNHFLGGLKLSPSLKSQVAVISSGEKIAWVVGKRIDDRFKLKANMPLVLKISWQDLQ
jgi:tRNA(Ile)-lysidine synthase